MRPDSIGWLGGLFLLIPFHKANVVQLWETASCNWNLYNHVSIFRKEQMNKIHLEHLFR